MTDEELDDRLRAIEDEVKNILATVIAIAELLGVEGYE